MARNRSEARAILGGLGDSRCFTYPILRPEAWASRGRLFVRFSNKLYWFSCGHGFVMFEAPYENKGSVKLIFESSSTHAARLAEY